MAESKGLSRAQQQTIPRRKHLRVRRTLRWETTSNRVFVRLEQVNTIW
jgi:hypothetical protein